LISKEPIACNGINPFRILMLLEFDVEFDVVFDGCDVAGIKNIFCKKVFRNNKL